jgi:putative cell wall-binding protein
MIRQFTQHSSTRRFRLRLAAQLVSAIVVVVGAAGLPTASASAETPSINCPQLKAVVGFPVENNVILPDPTPNLGVTLTGRLPAGLELFSDGTHAYVAGTPTTAEDATFFLKATVGVNGTPVEVSKECIMTVKPRPKITRIGGTDRYDQSAQVSRSTYDKAPIVYLASGEKFSDALSASAIAAHHNSPLLLTAAAAVAPAVLAEIKRLAPSDIVVVGGTASVSDSVVAQLATLSTSAGTPTVTRVGGDDRFEVSRNLIGHPSFGIAEAGTVYIATGFTFPDALGAAPAAARAVAPVLLVNGAESELSAAETATLTALGVTKATVVGGPASVSPALVSALQKSFTTTRIDGADRFQVNALLNEVSFPRAFSLYIASATVFPDALSGGAVAGRNLGPLYISASMCLSPEAYKAIVRFAPDEVIILGGTATLALPVENLMRCPVS